MKLKIVGKDLHKDLHIELEWFERLWSVHLGKSISIPLVKIKAMTAEKPQFSWRTLRAPGTYVPGLIGAGTYYTELGREFWYITRDRDYLVLDLTDEYYKRIILTLDENQTWLDRIKLAIAK